MRSLKKHVQKVVGQNCGCKLSPQLPLFVTEDAFVLNFVARPFRRPHYPHFQFRRRSLSKGKYSRRSNTQVVEYLFFQ